MTGSEEAAPVSFAPKRGACSAVTAEAAATPGQGGTAAQPGGTLDALPGSPRGVGGDSSGSVVRETGVRPALP